MLYGLAASALRETSNRAERPWRKYAGPNTIRMAAAATTAPRIAAWRRSFGRSTAMPSSILRQRSIACSTSRSTRRGDGPVAEASASSAEEDSIALRIAAWSVGSHSSR
jgi:hypothetical protein